MRRDDFSGANQDNRTGSLGTGTTIRTVILGARQALQDINGYWVSRALATNTVYYYRINGDSACDGGGPLTGYFQTKTLMTGRVFSDPIPAAPGGGSAWPRFYPSTQTVVIDPQTGVSMIDTTPSGDAPAQSASLSSFATTPSPYDGTGTWAGSSNTLVDDTLISTFTSANQAPLAFFINSGPGAQNPTYEAETDNPIDYINVEINGWSNAATLRESKREYVRQSRRWV